MVERLQEDGNSFTVKEDGWALSRQGKESQSTGMGGYEGEDGSGGALSGSKDNKISRTGEASGGEISAKGKSKFSTLAKSLIRSIRDRRKRERKEGEGVSVVKQGEKGGGVIVSQEGLKASTESHPSSYPLAYPQDAENYRRGGSVSSQASGTSLGGFVSPYLSSDTSNPFHQMSAGVGGAEPVGGDLPSSSKNPFWDANNNSASVSTTPALIRETSAASFEKASTSRPPPSLETAAASQATLTSSNSAVEIILSSLTIPKDSSASFARVNSLGYKPWEAEAARLALLAAPCPLAADTPFLPRAPMGAGSATATWGAAGFVALGYLFKKSAPCPSMDAPSGSLSFSSWEWRYATLGRGTFSYYKSEFDPKPSGEFALSDIVLVRPVGEKICGKPRGVEVRLGVGKAFFLVFQSDVEWEAWGGVLKACSAWVDTAAKSGESLSIELPGERKRGKKKWGLLF